MKTSLWMSAEVQADVGDRFRAANNDVETAMNTALTGLDFGSAFSSLLLIHIILDQDYPGYGETRRYRKRDREFDLRLKIPHAAFKAADAHGQRCLIVENILRAVDEMKKMRVKDVDVEKLEQTIRDVAAAKGWLPASLVH